MDHEILIDKEILESYSITGTVPATLVFIIMEKIAHLGIDYRSPRHDNRFNHQCITLLSILHVESGL